MLTNLSIQLNASPKKRHLLYLAATIATVLLIGYHFGTFDEAMHIPFLKATANPGLYDGDSMIGLHSIYYSYFWFFFIPFLKRGWLEPTLFVTHLATIYLSFWAIWDLGETLFHNPLTSLLSVVGFIVPHFSFVGFPVFEFAPLSRTFVLPFLLIAINQFFKERIPLAFFIAGLMYNIHIVSVNFVVAMFGLACLLEFRRIGIKKILLGAVLFLLAALPVLLWKAGGAPLDFSLRPEWVAFLNKTLFFHHFAMISATYPATWIVTLGGLSAIFLFFIAVPRADSRPVERSQPASTARIFIYAGCLVVLANVITANWLPVTIIIQSQIARIGLWILILAYLFFANYLVTLYRERAFSSPAFFLLLGMFIFSPSPILVLAAWLLVKYVKKAVVLKTAAALAPFIILASYGGIWMIGFWQPGIYIYGQFTPWVDVQNWARENTAADARFITPPEKWGVQESDWRVHSERASAGTLSEILVAAFQPGYEIEWKPRFEILAPGALEKFNGDYFWNVKVTKQAYYSLSTAAVLSAACQLHARYIVIEKPHTHPLPVAYENTGYTVFDVAGIACP